MKILLLMLTFLYSMNISSQTLRFDQFLVEKDDGIIDDFQIIDFDGDGDKDVVTMVVQDYGNGNQIKWYENINDEFITRYINNIDLSDFRLARLDYYKKGNSLLYDVYVMRQDIQNLSDKEYEIYILEQTPQLTFQKQLFFTSDRNINHYFKMADFNNDSQIDIIAFEETAPYSYKTIVYLNNIGVFNTLDLGLEFSSFYLFRQGRQFNNSYLSDMLLADINSDGLDDIIFINFVDNLSGSYSPFITYIKNTGNSTFNTQTFGPLETSFDSLYFYKIKHLLTIHDENNDGLKEIFFPSYVYPSKTQYILQSMEDNFSFGLIDIPGLNSSGSLEKGHLLFLNQDLDSDFDVFTIPYTSDYLDYYENNGDGTFTENQIIYTDNTIRKAAIIDLQNDGLEDIVVSQDSKLEIYEQNSLLSINKKALANELLGNVKIIENVNLNNDDKQDLIAISDFNSNLFLYTNQGNNQFNRLVIDTQQDNLIGVGSYDYNNDGFQDILTVSLLGFSEVKIDWYENQNNQVFIKHFFTNLTTFNTDNNTRFKFIDLDNDGDQDLMYQNKSGSTDWFENNQNVFEPYKSMGINAANDFFDFNLIDYDGDGDLDVTYSFSLTSFFNNSSTYWMELNENKDYILHTIEDNVSYKVFKPGDLNNDGLIDFIVKNGNNEVFIWLKTINGFDITPMVNVFLPESYEVVLVDIDESGTLDIVMGNSAYLNNGNLGFSLYNLNTSLGTNKQRLFYDSNNDNKIDVVTSIAAIKILDLTNRNYLFDDSFE